MEKFKTIKNNVDGILIEKKSKFIANIAYVESVEQAEEFIKSIKKKYYDAKHNVIAYAIETGDGGLAIKYNDDGEPSGTAGSPILKIILEKGLSNVVVVVTRYFGGVLLGTGGLVRAYSGAVINALDNAEFVEKKKGYKLKVVVEYDEADQIKYIVNKYNFKIIKVDYLNNVEFYIEIPEEKIDEFTKNGNNIFSKNLKYDIVEEKYIDI